MEKRDAGATVGVVLDGSNTSGDVVLVALEIDDTILALVAAALVTRGYTAVVVAARMLGQRTDQRLLWLAGGDLRVIGDRLEATSR